MTDEWAEKYQADSLATSEELRQRGINVFASMNVIVDERFTRWGEFTPFESTSTLPELADYKENLRPVEVIEGYPLNALESGFERYDDWLDLQTQLGSGEDSYVQRAFFADTEEEARAILEDYREQLRTGRDGVYQEFMDYLTEQYNSRDDIIL